ncbi:MAG: YnbE family lipoprotein [Alphaproteobacteria bacterium]|nr:YnbE family lipoprotein [Alphaproteobacteria bacterium]MCB1840989.1 YnbE family lipoprotein [Alphaproteobacteria bacterium]
MKKTAFLILCAAVLPACTPTVKVEAPDKPIEINMNVNIEHHVKVEIERDVKDAIAKNSDIF